MVDQVRLGQASRRPRGSSRGFESYVVPGGTFALYVGDCLKVLKTLDTESVDLIITSPPYNLGKEYETRTPLRRYLSWQRRVVDECCRITKSDGSICWQVGNYVENGEILPLDIAVHPMFKKNHFRLRNRIVWRFGHGAHQKKRFSGRYEVILWFTKSDAYKFNLDAVRIPQLYPTKRHFRGPHRGELSGNPLGKNPGDVWDISNVKYNHPEKTAHPCQFPEELVRRLILCLSRQGDLILDPFLGSGTTAAVALALGRHISGIEIRRDYAACAMDRLGLRISDGSTDSRGSEAMTLRLEPQVELHVSI